MYNEILLCMSSYECQLLHSDYRTAVVLSKQYVPTHCCSSHIIDGSLPAIATEQSCTWSLLRWPRKAEYERVLRWVAMKHKTKNSH